MPIHCGNNLKFIRELFNYTQVYVALKLKISDKTYRQFEKKENPPSEYYLDKLNQFYKFNVSDFINLTLEEIIEKISNEV
jgi:transcriptional regulator with XRE-family HTH domain